MSGTAAFIVVLLLIQSVLSNDPSMNQRDADFRRRLEDHVKNWWPNSEIGQASGVTGFNCPGGVSASVPRSVHQLRPGDIKVIGAMGDSLTAGNGAGARDVLEMLLQYRGEVFSIGGDDDLEHRVTVANILRKFNPHLFGQSHGIGDVAAWEIAYLNTAEPGMRSDDLVHQAHEMIQKMRSHPDDIDMANDWKMITIFIGGNDICDYCHNKQAFGPPRFIQNIKDTLTVLQQNIPRLLVSLMAVLHVEVARVVDADQPFCKFLHQAAECGCVDEPTFSDAEMSATENAYTALELELMMNGTFDTHDDFTMVVQPLLSNSTHVPRQPDGSIDNSYYTPDCFHFSAKLHSIVARGLWNNMLAPVGQKQNDYPYNSDNQTLNCPDPSCPFIRTLKNSRNCAQYLTPAKSD